MHSPVTFFHSQTVTYTDLQWYSKSVKGVMQQTLLVSVEVVFPRQKVCSFDLVANL